jgi:hypothetical protein
LATVIVPDKMPAEKNDVLSCKAAKTHTLKRSNMNASKYYIGGDIQLIRNTYTVPSGYNQQTILI